MKAVILAGGSGTRLYPVTQAVNKHILRIYNKPMIYYPLSLIMLLGIKDILFIVNPQDLKDIQNIFGDGSQLGMNMQYQVQEKPNGLAESLILAKDFIGDNNICYMLGDNVFFGHDLIKIMEDTKNEIEKNGEAFVFGGYVKDQKDLELENLTIMEMWYL